MLCVGGVVGQKGEVGFIIELWYFIFQHRSTLQDF